eukprot:Platyproteum_vivax@DN7489_c0_g1_i1.p1
MMKYFVLFASLLVVCFSKRVVLHNPLLNADIVFTLKREEGLLSGHSRKIFKIRITNLPEDATFEALQKVVEREDALQTFLDYLRKLDSSSSLKTWSAKVLPICSNLNPLNILGT